MEEFGAVIHAAHCVRPAAHAYVAAIIEKSHALVDGGVDGRGTGTGAVDFCVGVIGIHSQRVVVDVFIGIDRGNSRRRRVSDQHHLVQPGGGAEVDVLFQRSDLGHIVSHLLGRFHGNPSDDHVAEVVATGQPSVIIVDVGVVARNGHVSGGVADQDDVVWARGSVVVLGLDVVFYRSAVGAGGGCADRGHVIALLPFPTHVFVDFGKIGGIAVIAVNHEQPGIGEHCFAVQHFIVIEDQTAVDVLKRAGITFRRRDLIDRGIGIEIQPDVHALAHDQLLAGLVVLEGVDVDADHAEIAQHLGFGDQCLVCGVKSFRVFAVCSFPGQGSVEIQRDPVTVLVLASQHI